MGILQRIVWLYRVPVVLLFAAWFSSFVGAQQPVANVKPDFRFKRYVGVADVGALKADSSERIEFDIKNDTSIERNRTGEPL